MSAIAGIVGYKAQPKLSLGTLANAMIERLKHRGPDSKGIVLFDAFLQTNAFGEIQDTNAKTSHISFLPTEHVESESLKKSSLAVLAHRRMNLSGVAETGHQPLCSIDKKCWITFDGRLYNASKLREHLKSAGHHFYGNSDAEVVLNAYREWGSACVHHLNGMWAFSILDSTTKKIFASRDRIGVRPFYFLNDGQYFAFASEQKAFLDLPFFKHRIDSGAVFDFFILRQIEQKSGFFKNLQELRPAHSLELHLETGSISTWQYYDLPFDSSTPVFETEKFEDYQKNVRDLLLDSIRMHSVGMTTKASLLSGGLDSSVIAVGLKKLFPSERAQHFTIAFEQGAFDERSWAQDVVNKTGAEGFTIYPKYEEFVKDLETFVYSQDFPLASMGTYTQFCAMRKANDAGVKMIMDGQGADALFAGHLPHSAALWKDLILGSQYKRVKEEFNSFGGRKSSFKFLLRNQMKYQWMPKLPVALQWQFTKRYFDEVGFFNKDFLAANRKRFKLYKNGSMNSLNQMLYSGYFKGGLALLLKRLDRSSSWNGIEVRLPYVDDLKLTEYVFSIPSTYKIDKTHSKLLLREAFKDLLPTSVYERVDKIALPSPNNEWTGKMAGEMRSYFEDMDDAVFNKKALLTAFDDFFKPNSTQENYRIFRFFGFALWQRAFKMKM